MATTFAMSDMHGNLDALEEALGSFELGPEDRLVFLGDYGDRGPDGGGVMRRVMALAQADPRVTALLGNHDQMLLDFVDNPADQALLADDLDRQTLRSLVGGARFSTLPDQGSRQKTVEALVEEAGDVLGWLASLPRLVEEDDVLYVHGGVREEAGEDWFWETSEDDLVWAYPPRLGPFCRTVVAGHVRSQEICGIAGFAGVVWDGASHFYIDGSAEHTGVVPVLARDRETGVFTSPNAPLWRLGEGPVDEAVPGAED